MKTTHSFLIGTVAVFVLGTLVHADTIFVATLNGDSEAPSSTGSGHAVVDYNPVMNDITYSLTFQNLGSDATMSHIHSGLPGTNGPILLWFFPPTLTPTPTATSGHYTGTWTPADLASQSQNPSITTFTELLSALNSGDTYVNVHSVNFPGGEIRGQLSMTPEPSSLMLVGLPFALLGLIAISRRRRHMEELGRG
jgi:hypothetical protein